MIQFLSSRSIDTVVRKGYNFISTVETITTTTKKKKKRKKNEKRKEEEEEEQN